MANDNASIYGALTGSPIRVGFSYPSQGLSLPSVEGEAAAGSEGSGGSGTAWREYGTELHTAPPSAMNIENEFEVMMPETLGGRASAIGRAPVSGSIVSARSGTPLVADGATAIDRTPPAQLREPAVPETHAALPNKSANAARALLQRGSLLLAST
jgi:hypothetical protein